MPVLYWLPDGGRADTAGAERFAAQWGIALVQPYRIRPEDAVQPDDAGFYRYALRELPALIEARFPVTGQRGLIGHGSGGHAALLAALSEPGRYTAVSAFAPAACLPQAAGFLPEGTPPAAARSLDSLLQTAAHRLPILIDHGSADTGGRLPESFAGTARSLGFPTRFHLRTDYGSGRHLAATFIDSHIEFHADAFGL